MNDDELIEQLIKITGTQLDINKDEYCPVYKEEWHEVIALIDKHRHQKCRDAIKALPCSRSAAEELFKLDAIEAIDEVFSP